MLDVRLRDRQRSVGSPVAPSLVWGAAAALPLRAVVDRTITVT
jgi:hypothetical protein